MKIRIVICFTLAFSLAVSWVTFAKAVVEDDQIAVAFLPVKSMAGEVPVLFVPYQKFQEVNISDEHVAIARSALLLPINHERPPPMGACNI